MQVGVHEYVKGVIIHLVTFYCSKNSGQTLTDTDLCAIPFRPYGYT